MTGACHVPYSGNECILTVLLSYMFTFKTRSLNGKMVKIFKLENSETGSEAKHSQSHGIN